MDSLFVTVNGPFEVTPSKHLANTPLRNTIHTDRTTHNGCGEHTGRIAAAQLH